jgi:hypothetical protein
MNNKNKFKRFKDSNDGVTGIVVALLLLGLFMTMLAFVQTVYVPQWMEQKEAEHMDQVANQFNQLKFAVDILAMNNKPNIPISSPITLGSKEMPFLISSRSYGILDLSQEDFRIVLENTGKSYEFFLGSFKYFSKNSYFIDQTYVYENGALILSQSSGDFISISPAFSVIRNKQISINLIKLNAVYGKNTASGYGTYPIQTKFIKSESVPLYYIENITIYSNYKDSWWIFLEGFLSDFDQESISYDLQETTDGGIKIEFLQDDESGIEYPTVEVYITEIELQISPGWMS